MGKELLLAVLLMLLAISQGVPAEVKVTEDAELVVGLDGNGYKDVVVALRDDLDEKDCKVLVEGIQTMMLETSQMLHQATRGKLYFAEVTVLLPATWTCTDVPSESTTFTNYWHTAHLRVGPTHPVFGDNLWTQQPRGCGEEGDFIYIPEEWLSSYLQGEGSSVKELVGQWARYRWGVFGEEGHQGDDLHPPTFLTQYNASALSLRPNLCHNGNLEGSLSGECDNLEDTTDCLFSVNPEESANVTSSLLSLPSLSSVLEFCDESTHDFEAPTKQNLMCGSQSAWEVMAQHADLDGRDEWQGNVEPTFRVVTAEQSSQPLHPNVVVVMEYTSTMNETFNRWKFLHDAVTKFLLVEAPQGMKVGLVSLMDSATTLAGLTTLRDSTSRQSLADLVPQDPPTVNITRNLEAGITEAATMLGGDGVVVLLVENLDNHTSETLDDLVAAAGNTSVHIILYPHLVSSDTSLYEELVNATGGSLLPVVNPYGPNFQSVDDLVALNQHFRTILQATMTDDTDWKNWKQEVYGLCSANCSMTLDLLYGSQYQSEIVLELSFLSFDAAGLTNVEMTAPDGTVLTPSDTLQQDTLRHYFYTQTQEWQSGNYTVQVERQTYVDEVVVSLLVKYRASTTPVVWASQPLLDLQPSTTSPPTLFVQLWQGQNHVVEAMVTATITSARESFAFNLTDDGTRGDTTGGDGVYSGIIMGVSGQASLAIEGHDKEGAALLVGSQSSHALDKYSRAETSGSQVCCGSYIDLSQVSTEAAGSFSFSTSVDINVQGEAIVDPPPSRVTDVRVVLGLRSTSGVALQFTASGEDFYYGTAPSYEVTSQSLTSNETVVEVIEAPTANTNSMVILELQENENECDVIQVFSVRALDGSGQMSDVSNQPRKVIPCVAAITTDTDTPSSSPSTDDTDSTPTPTDTSSSPATTDDTDTTPTPTDTPSSSPSTDDTDTTATPTDTPSTDDTDTTATPTDTPSTDDTDTTATPTDTPSTDDTDTTATPTDTPSTDDTDTTPTPTDTPSSPPSTDDTDTAATPTDTPSSPPTTDDTDTPSSPPTTDNTDTPSSPPSTESSSSPPPTDNTETTTVPPTFPVSTDTSPSPTASPDVTTDTTTTTTEASTSSSNDNLGAILGGVFGGLACLIVIGVAGKFIYAKWAAKKAADTLAAAKTD